jgi:error-prone DNA polymerase
VTAAPDIDLDFPRDIRAKLIPRIHKRYGADRSALVAAFPTYRSRGAIREFGKALGIPAAEIERAARSVDFHGGSDDLERDLASAVGEQRAAYVGWKNLVWLTREARGLPRTRPALRGHGDLDQTADRDLPGGAAAMEERPDRDVGQGLLPGRRVLKIDLLGLGMLSAVERSVDEIHRIRGETVDLSRIDLADETTFEAIRRADTTGSSRSRAGPRCRCCHASGR